MREPGEGHKGDRERERERERGTERYRVDSIKVKTRGGVEDGCNPHREREKKLEKTHNGVTSHCKPLAYYC